ncbi:MULTISPECIES: response regulator [Desulfococcus]|jgi:DNA-binding NtrC family response regulator|uniref:Response regulator receiver protein n=1 Tax=Desulfococcus multivorans DSM 2059 TaxID=1121405 RepID=S7VDL4_DESML|nr:response regulator [Desulfococcus multivorans]AOY58367.1 two component system response regulator [Desulfococcus multivorans]AQV02933.2 response regulator [Desulfococcus multivorans]EPR42558.1 response regulator receiver protein [Desulfococcus multivorans DSM 2059]MDX9818872.1 response regulator [Desulfococcus multivorans]SKA18736.1 Response regulator receiver domain-containing protein [Desulfococcus multivorans DSM 2059]
MNELAPDINVLLVDDEIAFVETITKRLKKRHFIIQTAHSGMEAMEKLEENGNATEVVVLDVKMPGMDGIETLAEIKRKFPLKEVIMLTGHATVSSAIEGMKKGAFDYLLKPCEMSDLVSKVNRAAEKKREHEKRVVEARMQELMRTRAQ